MFLFLRDFFELVDVVVSQFLNFGETLFLIVLGDLFIFEQFFQVVVAVAADIANSGAMFFEDFMDVLGELFAAFFGKGRNRNTNETPVV